MKKILEILDLETVALGFLQSLAWLLILGGLVCVSLFFVPKPFSDDFLFTTGSILIISYFYTWVKLGKPETFPFISPYFIWKSPLVHVPACLGTALSFSLALGWWWTFVPTVAIIYGYNSGEYGDLSKWTNMDESTKRLIILRNFGVVTFFTYVVYLLT